MPLLELCFATLPRPRLLVSSAPVRIAALRLIPQLRDASTDVRL